MDKYEIARRKVKKRKGFYQHLAAYVSVIGFLFALNLITEPWDIWAIYPALSWGLALSIHYLNTFGFPGTKGVMTDEWEAREIEKELDKMGAFGEPPAPKIEIENEELELKEFKKLRSEWDDQEFV